MVTYILREILVVTTHDHGWLWHARQGLWRPNSARKRARRRRPTQIHYVSPLYTNQNEYSKFDWPIHPRLASSVVHPLRDTLRTRRKSEIPPGLKFKRYKPQRVYHNGVYLTFSRAYYNSTYCYHGDGIVCVYTGCPARVVYAERTDGRTE